MSMDFQEQDRRVRAGQIIIAAMAGGIVALAAVVVQLHVTGQMPARNGGTHPIITYVALATALMCVAPAVLVPRLVIQDRVRGLASLETDDARARALLEAWLTSLIIRGALIEGPALFLVVAFLVERKSVSLAVAALLTVVLVAMMPTRDRVGRWVERHLRPAG